MRIAIGQVSHETNTFCSIQTTTEIFKSTEWGSGKFLIETHEGVQDYLGGIIDCCKKHNAEILPSFTAYTPPSGIVTVEAFENIKKNLIAELKNVFPFDGICLAFHGAGVAEGIDDLEGELLKEIRKNFGYSVPIVVALDLHANLTELMVKEADMLLGVLEYPHIDSYECGYEAANFLIKIINKDIKPIMTMEKIPLLIPTFPTSLEPMKELNALCKSKENLEDVLDCTIYHGFPYTDIPDLGVAVLCTTNSNKTLSSTISKEISRKLWEDRELFNVKYPTPEEGIKKALQLEDSPVLLNETSDNPGAGTPGNGTHLLKTLINHKEIKSCFGFICDENVVDIAVANGVGSTILAFLGGKTDDLHGEPLEIKAYVKSITDGKFIQSSPMWKGLEVNIGTSVRLQVGHVDIIVSSQRNQTFDEQVFLLHGINIYQYKIVAIKSSVHFKAAFKDLIKEIITVDSPGLSTCNLQSFQYERVDKRMYPLSTEVEVL